MTGFDQNTKNYNYNAETAASRTLYTAVGTP